MKLRIASPLRHILNHSKILLALLGLGLHATKSVHATHRIVRLSRSQRHNGSMRTTLQPHFFSSSRHIPLLERLSRRTIFYGSDGLYQDNTKDSSTVYHDFFTLDHQLKELISSRDERAEELQQAEDKTCILLTGQQQEGKSLLTQSLLMHSETRLQQKKTEPSPNVFTELDLLTDRVALCNVPGYNPEQDAFNAVADFLYMENILKTAISIRVCHVATADELCWSRDLLTKALKRLAAIFPLEKVQLVITDLKGDDSREILHTAPFLLNQVDAPQTGDSSIVVDPMFLVNDLPCTEEGLVSGRDHDETSMLKEILTASTSFMDHQPSLLLEHLRQQVNAYLNDCCRDIFKEFQKAAQNEYYSHDLDLLLLPLKKLHPDGFPHFSIVYDHLQSKKLEDTAKS